MTMIQSPAIPIERPSLEIRPYLKLMVEKDASDLYFTTNARVNIKINGVTTPVGKNVLPSGAVREILPEILSAKQLAEFEEEMELDTAFTIEGIGRFRVNVFRQRGEEAMVIRQIKAQIPDLDSLLLPELVKTLVMEQRGLIIIAGATGTGKSTTVASMLDYRNQHKTGHILTIEDPIEFMYEHKKSIVNQREVGIDTKSFDEALRRAMREAPDVIMIGEIRDASTMKQALSYADTGHLCIATLHATNAVQTMERINSFFPVANREQLYMDMSLNLRAVIAQRLLIDKYGKRIPATEVLLNEPQVKTQIREGQMQKLKDVLEKAPPGSPLHSFDNDIMRLFNAGLVTMEEALVHADDPEHLKVKVRLAGGMSSDSENFFDT
jgi:twitching motility protein PilU